MITAIKNNIVILLSSLIYFVWVIGVIGLRPEHIYTYLIAFVLYNYNNKSKELFFGFLPFIILWITYDTMRVWPNYMINTVHIAEPYLFDKYWFGIETLSGRLTLNEFFATRTNLALDIITALFYLSWVPLPMAFAVYLWYNDRNIFYRFSYAYLATNIIGFSLYYIYPAAPPWYVELNGFNFVPNTLRSSAGLQNFDSYFNIELFDTIYKRNSNVFAAIPSLHSAYPLVTFYYTLKMKAKWPAKLFGILTIGIWFSALYLRHHYVIDVLLGAMVATMGYSFVELYYRNTKTNWEESVETVLTDTVNN
jgi:hypothetical protein